MPSRLRRRLRQRLCSTLHRRYRSRAYGSRIFAAGLMGSGRTELAMSLFGRLKGREGGSGVAVHYPYGLTSKDGCGAEG